MKKTARRFTLTKVELGLSRAWRCPNLWQSNRQDNEILCFKPREFGVYTLVLDKPKNFAQKLAWFFFAKLAAVSEVWQLL
jgi:hypothetical protein